MGQETMEYKAGEEAAVKELEQGIETKCPYQYTGYEDTPYRRWMKGYWDVISLNLGDGT